MQMTQDHSSAQVSVVTTAARLSVAPMMDKPDFSKNRLTFNMLKRWAALRHT